MHQLRLRPILSASTLAMANTRPETPKATDDLYFRGLTIIELQEIVRQSEKSHRVIAASSGILLGSLNRMINKGGRIQSFHY